MKTWKYLLCALGLFCSACEYDNLDVEHGPDGEPGPGLKQTYSGEFRALTGDYFAALNKVYSFGHENEFEIVGFGKCFDEILDVRSEDSDLPCRVMFASKGAPTKAYLTFTVTGRSFFRHDDHDFLIYRVDLFINRCCEHVRDFHSKLQAELAPGLTGMTDRVDSLIHVDKPPAPDNKALQPTREDARG